MNDLRLLNTQEISCVSGGFVLTGYENVCPSDEWWNPNWFTDDAGQIQQMPAQNGPIDGYWTDGNVWCLYDSDNNLLGVYREDPNGSLTLTFSNSYTVVDPYYVAGTNAEVTTGGSYTVQLSPIQ